MRPVVLPVITPTTKPEWNPDTRELSVNGVVIRRLEREAKNQFIVLSAFQEDQWVSRIDDPLPRTPGVDPHQRLRDTAKRLNEQDVACIRFERDGTGKGIRWRWITPEEQEG